MATDILIDSNLLVLLVAGLSSRRIINRHRRLQAYDEADYDELRGIVSRGSRLVLTPNVCTEASNHLRQTAEPDRKLLSSAFEKLIDNSTEFFVESRQAASMPEFSRLGLTDSVLLHLSAGRIVLLTVDLDLYLAVIGAGYQAVNFMHLKDNRQ